MSVRATLIRIGNSRGIRIPKSLIDECRFGDIVELSVHDGSLVIQPVPVARHDWDLAFEHMAATGDDQLLDDDETQTEFERTEWEWPEE